VDKALEDVEPGVALPDLLPEVGAAPAAGVWRIASAAVLGAAVEREELRVAFGKLRRQEDDVGVDAKCTTARLESSTSFGSRSCRYCFLASVTVCPLSAFLSSRWRPAAR